MGLLKNQKSFFILNQAEINIDMLNKTKKTLGNRADVPIRQRFIDEWAEKVPHFEISDNLIDIVEKTDLTHEDMSLEIPFQDTKVELRLNDIGVRVLKTLYTSAKDLHANCIDYRAFYLLFNLKDNFDQYRWELLTEVKDQEEIMMIFAMYYWIENIWYDKSIKVLGLKEIMGAEESEINSEVRALLLTLPSMNLSELLTKVDTYVHHATNREGMKNGVYDLFKGTIMGEEVTYVRTYDASTDRMFFMAVDGSRVTKAIDAAPSLLRVPEKLIPHIKSIYRQGEKFLITWDKIDQKSKKFQKKLESTKVPLTAEQYWGKMVEEH